MNTMMQDLKALCDLFGPSGYEDDVRHYLAARLREAGYTPKTDALGNLLLELGQKESDRTLLFEAHMDEVAFMIRGISEGGLLRFGTVGGIDPRVLCGKRVLVRGKEGKTYPGVIGAKPIHLQSADERERVTKADRMYIDIGATDREDAEQMVEKGDYAVFDSPFVRFGDGEGLYKGRAIDDRLGCAVLLRIAERLARENTEIPYRLVFSFGVREEVGFSGAKPATYAIAPTHVVALETTAIGDLPDTPEHARVADVGRGGVLSVADGGTIYDKGMIRFALDVAKEEGIAVQVKRYVSGGNNARHMQQTGTGARALALSAPTRYLHSPACVADAADCEAIEALSYQLIRHFPQLSDER